MNIKQIYPAEVARFSGSNWVGTIDDVPVYVYQPRALALLKLKGFRVESFSARYQAKGEVGFGGIELLTRDTYAEVKAAAHAELADLLASAQDKTAFREGRLLIVANLAPVVA